jgi:serine/threonine protein kinase
VTSARTSFQRCALAGDLLTQEQLAAARAALAESERETPSSTATTYDERLAAKLVELGYLNLWQSRQLLDGRTKFRLGPYRIIDSIGRGGMGQVFKAEHDVLGRIVAVKVLPRSRSTPEAIASFNREIRSQAKLDHENLVRAFDAGEDGNVCYLVTEYVPGMDLRKYVRTNGPLSMAEAARVISQVALALQHAHDRGLIHRDVKPGNILVTPDGRAKLSDLGLAGPLQDAAETDPRFGRIVGTADYLSPDHIECPWSPTPAWDIYSLGCTLYYTVTGKVPFPGGTTADKVQAHLRLRPLDPRRLNPRLGDQFIDVIAQMMAKNPVERIGSPAEVVQRLAPWAQTAGRTGVPGQAEHFGPAPMAAPPGVAQGQVLTRLGIESSGYEDTESAFPELPETGPVPKDNASQVLQATQPIASAGEETYSTLDRYSRKPTSPAELIEPFALLVLLPTVLVAVIYLVGWLIGAW